MLFETSSILLLCDKVIDTWHCSKQEKEAGAPEEDKVLCLKNYRETRNGKNITERKIRIFLHWNSIPFSRICLSVHCNGLELLNFL